MAEQQGLLMVPFEDIEIDALGNPRKDMGNVAELADDITEKGLIEPVVVLYKHYGGNGTVRPDGKKVYTRYMLVDGGRRMAALAVVRKRKHGLFEKVPCSLFRGNETDARLAQLAANLQRKDMNPVEVADAVRKLVVCGLSQAQIAKSTHLSPSYVSTLISIREKCSTPVLAALSSTAITIETAMDLSRLDEKQQPAALDKHLGVKREKGKAEAKRQTAKDAGRKVKPNAKEVREIVGKAIARLNADGAKDADKQFWRGAMTAVQCLMGDGEELLELAKPIIEKEVA